MFVYVPLKLAHGSQGGFDLDVFCFDFILGIYCILRLIMLWTRLQCFAFASFCSRSFVFCFIAVSVRFVPPASLSLRPSLRLSLFAARSQE
jgi:hypothetical protein